MVKGYVIYMEGRECKTFKGYYHLPGGRERELFKDCVIYLEGKGT